MVVKDQIFQGFLQEMISPEHPDNRFPVFLLLLKVSPALGIVPVTRRIMITLAQGAEMHRHNKRSVRTDWAQLRNPRPPDIKVKLFRQILEGKRQAGYFV